MTDFPDLLDAMASHHYRETAAVLTRHRMAEGKDKLGIEVWNAITSAEHELRVRATMREEYFKKDRPLEERLARICCARDMLVPLENISEELRQSYIDQAHRMVQLVRQAENERTT